MTSVPAESSTAAPSRVRACADFLLARGGLWENPYFEALRDGRLSLEGFRTSQEQFYFAVVFFPRPMAGLIARSPDYASRVDILHNVVEEHGDFRPSHAHAATFAAFLGSLGTDPDRLHGLRPAPAVHAFNSVLFSACLLEELEVGIGCIGIIEHAFAELSARIGNHVVSRGWVPREKLVHYSLHAELDRQHADEFFAIVEPRWDDPAKRELIERGLALGAHVFDRLYRELLDLSGVVV
ncbi:MAG: pyrroloquinoline-quinone synthase [Chthoniobacter sp.]|jgi:pyrroloquinoline-quinone synthase|nr:pyrroloquinoline-quinone synthase [Chthoniobacter sp.]